MEHVVDLVDPHLDEHAGLCAPDMAVPGIGGHGRTTNVRECALGHARLTGFTGFNPPVLRPVSRQPSGMVRHGHRWGESHETEEPQPFGGVDRDGFVDEYGFARFEGHLGHRHMCVVGG